MEQHPASLYQHAANVEAPAGDLHARCRQVRPISRQPETVTVVTGTLGRLYEPCSWVVPRLVGQSMHSEQPGLCLTAVA